ncbi:MAG: Regulatory protein luxR family [Verrucomicrobia bacterium]|nr:Regulatory protein luxR family [Verrucomicrobiota bacterium]
MNNSPTRFRNPGHRGPPAFSETSRALRELQFAVTLETFWRTTVRLLESHIPHHSCSLMLGIVDYQPSEGHHHVTMQDDRGNQPVTSLSISSNFLAAHPRVKLYTYGEVIREDPLARLRGHERKCQFGGWGEFIHLAFWHGSQPGAVLSVRRTSEQGDLNAEERDFLSRLHPIIDAGLRRLRFLENERCRCAAMERFIATLPMPVMFLDSAGALDFATQDAYDMCATWNYGPKEARQINTRRSAKIPPEIVAACTRLETKRLHALAMGAHPALEGERVEHPRIPRFVARVAISEPMSGFGVQPGYWVTFSAERNLDGASAELTGEAGALLHLLTPSERRVALLVAEGCRNLDVARRLGKSLRTVEFQLNAVYRKLTLNGRTELTHLLS